MYNHFNKMTDKDVSKTILEIEAPTPPKTNPKFQKYFTLGLVGTISILGTTIPTGGLLEMLVSKMSDINIYKCSAQCVKRFKDDKDISSCYKQCKYSGTQWALSYINKEFSKCNNAKNPARCRKILSKLMITYKTKIAKEKLALNLHKKKMRLKGNK